MVDQAHTGIVTQHSFKMVQTSRKSFATVGQQEFWFADLGFLPRVKQLLALEPC